MNDSNQSAVWQAATNQFIDFRKIFFLFSAFMIPFQIASITFFERINLPLCILVSLLDYKALRNWGIFVAKHASLRSGKIQLLCIAFATTVFVSKDYSILLLLKVFVSFYFTNYVYQGLTKYGYRPIRYGITFACFFASLQFLEVTLFDTKFLDSRGLFVKLGDAILIGNSGSLGYSYAIGLGGFPRVSGLSAEPGFFSAMLLGFLPLGFLSRQLLCIMLLGLLISLSKISMLGLPAMIFAFMWVSLFKKAWSATLWVPVILFLLAPLFISDAAFVERLSPSLYFRVMPSFVWHEFDVLSKLFGSFDPCKMASPHLMSIGEFSGVNYRSSTGLCLISDGLSFYGSMLTSFGIFGVVLFVLIIKRIGSWSSPKHSRFQVLSRFFLMSVCYAFLSTNFFAFNPPLLACLALAIWFASRSRSNPIVHPNCCPPLAG